jgi:hypothetical protein
MADRMIGACSMGPTPRSVPDVVGPAHWAGDWPANQSHPTIPRPPGRPAFDEGDRMDRDEAEFPSPAGPSGRPTREESEILDSLDLYHRRGPGPHPADVRWWRILPFLLACLAVCFGSVFYSDLMPPSLSTLVAGFAVGVLVMVTRREMAFQKSWPLLDRVIDWKLVERMRQDRGRADGRSPDPSGPDLDDLR